jgi:photosystem II stability/assembly factor-like uncharacterized protein
MKKLIFTVLIFNISLLSSSAQWIQQYTGTTADLYSIKFINYYTGFTCGGGVILKTTNEGNNWILLDVPVSKQLLKIHPVDSNNIYCVGMYETIIKSTNGGVNWIVIRDGAYLSNTYKSLFFINKNTGWMGGGPDRKILKTTNGGLNFDSIVTITPGNIQDIYFKDSLNGLYCDDEGAVRKSTNGGYNWFTINIPVGSYVYDFQNFTFINNQAGWTVTWSGKVFRTTDFGSNWDSLPRINNSGNPLSSIFFSSNNVGYCGGAGYFLYRTTNGGNDWIQSYLPYPLNGASSIFFINDSVGWKAATLGRIFHTTNGGQGTVIIKNNEKVIDDYSLFQNCPNPFNGKTTIKYTIHKKNIYKLELYNILGEKVYEIFDKELIEGNYKINFNAGNLTSGIYIYKLSSTNTFLIKKFILLK